MPVGGFTRGVPVACDAIEGLRQFGQAEIDDLYQSAVGHHDVGGFEVTMDDAGQVRRRQSVSDLHGVLEGLPDQQPISFKQGRSNRCQ